MPDITEVADRFRAEILRRERAAASELVRAYGAIWRRIRERLGDLLSQIEQAEARGETVDPEWLFERGRLEVLLQQVQAELARYAIFAEGVIVADQAEAVRLAAEHAEALMRAALGPALPGVTIDFARLPIEALEELVGVLADGSPLRSLLDELGPNASASVRSALITGLAIGRHPRDIARDVRAALGANMVRALTIARTETLRAYRESSRRTFQANSDVVRSWLWRAKLDTKTCAYCWSMHGTRHPLDEPMATHPRCRCALVPQTASWRELGFEGVPETRVELPYGPDEFAKLPEERQLAILGPRKYAAYRDGLLRLEDLRGLRYDPRWGRVGYERPLSALGLTAAAGGR